MEDIERLLLVDPLCARRAPTIRAWLEAATEVLPRHFKEVEVWSMENELDIPGVKWRKFPKISPFWPIQSEFFCRMAWRRFRSLSADYLSSTIVQCAGEHLPQSDIRLIQFWNIAYDKLAKSKPDALPITFKNSIFIKSALRKEYKCLEAPATGEWWCVSRGIAQPIQQDAPSGSVFKILPNTYDPIRFNPEVRQKFRKSARHHYGFEDDEIVLAFCSFGHFVRKGLLQAVEVINGLRAEGIKVRLLVLGGSSGTIDQFRNLMVQRSLRDDGIYFAGGISPVERHLAAADGLFFPSHFEAFSLVEIEAAALGLRLYLTAHPGSEMILREGINGRLLPWDIDGMTNVLREEICSGEIFKFHRETGEALTPREFAATLSNLYEDAKVRKQTKSGGGV